MFNQAGLWMKEKVSLSERDGGLCTTLGVGRRNKVGAIQEELSWFLFTFGPH